MADLTTLLSKFLTALWAGAASMPVGSGGATAAVSGVLSVNTTQAGTGADTNETDLWTYTLPANTLTRNGDAVRITAWGSLGADANTKTGRLYFGSTVISTLSTTNNAGIWRFDAVIVRTSATAQLSDALVSAGTALGTATVTTPSEALSGAVVIKVTGQNGSAVANDVVFRGAIVEALG